MKLNRKELKNKEAWAEIGIKVPEYDVAAAAAKAVEAPRWIHFGIGNIFRIFLGGIADELLEKGLLDRGITCIETFDFDVVDKIYTPFDDLVLSVILKSDGTRDMKVLGSLAEAIKADPANAEQWGRMLAAFASQDLQLITFTITEKGYALTSSDGVYLPYVQKDIENGPDQARGAMGVVAAGLFRRFEEGALPVALVSMDNCANNGRLLKESVVTMAEEWAKLGFVPEAFVEYVSDEETVAFCCTMIDKITPRPSEQIADDLEALGIEDMQPVITSKRTYIAPFANGEGPQYVVIEDRFPNGRPMLEEGFGVYLGDYDTVSRSERMKVTALLNPVHSATGPIGVVLGIDLFADMLEQVPAVLKMAKAVAYQEGLPMVKDPGILSPQAFVDELFEDRFPNKY
nr:mannitol dehydrogenase family protein [Clostridiales bacterium]